jgi:hydroxypyruvate isomerase
MPDFAARLEIGLPNQDLSEQLAAIAQRGYDAVEVSASLAVPPATLATELRQHGLAAVVLDVANTDASLICDPKRINEFRAALGGALSWAKAIGCWNVNCPVGALPPGIMPDTAMETIADNLRYATRAALPGGLRILLEPVPLPAGAAPAVCHIVDAVALLDVCETRNLSLLLNLAAGFGRRETLTAIIGRYLTRIGYIRVGTPLAAMRLPAEALEQVIRFADQAGYRGWIGCGSTSAFETAPEWLERFPRHSARGLVWGMPKDALRLSA